MGKRAAIIIVNWNGKRYLSNCLKSVFRQNYKNFEVYFVDNGSIDGSVQYIAENFPKVRIIQLNKNYGFAKGNNEGIKIALEDKSVEYIVCLNNDTVVAESWLKELVRSAQKNEKIGAVGSKLLYFHNKKIINTMGIVPLKNGNALNLYKNELSKDHKKEEIIFGPCAGAALYKRRILEETGLFDESYFCYLEDVDLAYRINNKGFYCISNPKSTVLHIHSGTSSKNISFKWFLINKNSLINSYKYYGWTRFMIYPILTLRYYKSLRKKKNIKDEINKINKFSMTYLIMKAYLFALIDIFTGKIIK